MGRFIQRVTLIDYIWNENMKEDRWNVCKVGGEQFRFVRAWIESNASQRRKKVGIVKAENLMGKEDFKKNSQNEFKNKWHKKKMYGQFVREMLEEIE